MISRNHPSDFDVVARYTSQPAKLPGDLRGEIESLWRDDQVQFYALADLDESLNLTCNWIVLGEKKAAWVVAQTSSPEQDIKIFARNRIQAISQTQGMSCSHLSILGLENIWL